MFKNPERYSHLHLLVTTAGFVQFFYANTSSFLNTPPPPPILNATVVVFYFALEHSGEPRGDDSQCTNYPAKAIWSPRGNHSPVAQTQINFGGSAAVDN